MDRHVVSPSLLKLVNRGNLKVDLRQAYFVQDCQNFVAVKNMSINRESDSDTATENNVKSAPAKQLKLSLSKEKPRFASPLPEDMMTEIQKGKGASTPSGVQCGLLGSSSNGSSNVIKCHQLTLVPKIFGVEALGGH